MTPKIQISFSDTEAESRSSSRAGPEAVLPNRGRQMLLRLSQKAFKVPVSPWAGGWPLTAILPNLMCGGIVETTPRACCAGFRGSDVRDLKLMAQPLLICPLSQFRPVRWPTPSGWDRRYLPTVIPNSNCEPHAQSVYSTSEGPLILGGCDLCRRPQSQTSP